MIRLSNKEVKNSRERFWWAWTILISMPVSVGAWLFSEGSWWASPSAVFISTVIAYNVFESWLKRRQRRADDTVVLCYCTHHLLQHDGINECVTDFCYCTRYTPRFWQMSNRT